MLDATDIQGTVFTSGSATLLARAVGADASPLTQADIASAQYTVYLLDQSDPDAATPVAGHEDVSVGIASLIFDSLQTDALWDADETGYNFKHVLDVSTDPAFALTDRSYRIVFTLTPTTGQIVLVRFRVHAI